MKKIAVYYFTLLFIICISTEIANCQQTLTTDVLVVGGGTAGSAAGIQSARLKVQTIIAEPTTWLGGMFSAAGVPAFDGNHNMPSGIWAEFREAVYKVYGGADKVSTGWVSNTLFEPHVGDSILKAFIQKEPYLKVHYQLVFQKTIVVGNQVKGTVFYDKVHNKNVIIYAKQTIDATELGDVMASAKIPFDIGMEASSITGENVIVSNSNNIIQDITYAAILKDYGSAADKTIPKPANYDPMEFDGCCNEFCSTPSKLTTNVSAKKMLEYGKLPNGKYMINWPGKGNDIYLNIISLNEAERTKALEKAKAKTLRFLYFLQTQFGFKNLGLADDEFPTKDLLPLIPYHRESRRLKGIVRFKVNHISNPFNEESPYYRTGISVGDYPIDHHHRENPNAPQHLNFYPIPSFNVPLGSLIPSNNINGIIVAEKSISVSNIVNGTTRLQPCVMLTGQAAGTLAALCVIQKKQAKQISVRAVQQQLLNSKAYIMPYYDVKPDHPHFEAIQKIGATGILKGVGQPYLWANRTWFYPDSLIAVKELKNNCKPLNIAIPSNDSLLSIADAIQFIQQYNKNISKQSIKIPSLEQIQTLWNKEWQLKNFNLQRLITREELAVLLNNTLNPFNQIQINHYGHFIY